MFGIPTHIEKEIAHYNVRHSWAVYYMLSGDPYKMEHNLYEWIKKTAHDIAVAKVIREVLFLFLESEAVRKYNAEHTERLFDDALPYLPSSYDAAHYGLQQLSYPSDYDIIKAVVDLLEQMRKNELTPFGRVDISATEHVYADDGNPFFPVGLRPIFWGNAELFEFPPYVPTKFVGIVDLETGYTFATASYRYYLYTNKDVFDLLMEIAHRVFRTSYHSEIVTKHTLINKRGVCKMLAERAIGAYFPYINDGWQAVIQAVNSYDKTEPLRYTFGFVNDCFRIPLLMLDYTISVNTAHIVPFEKFRQKTLDTLHWDVELNEIETAFRKIIESLKSTALSDIDMLPLFCKYFDYNNVPESKTEQDNLLELLKTIEDSVREETKRYGRNAYAMLHVIMSYVSQKKESLYFRNEAQLGKWVAEFTKAAATPNFSIHRYIGPDPYDVVTWYSLHKD